MNASLPAIGHILVPLDGSSLAEQAIPYAQSLLCAGGSITLLRVIPHVEPFYDPIGMAMVSTAEMIAQSRTRAEEELMAAVKRWGNEEYGQIAVATRVGEPVVEILRAADDSESDLIVMASKGRGAFGRLALGSVTDRVSRTASLPVVVIRPDDALIDMSRPLLRRILVPLDGSERAESSLPNAEALARRLHASIHLVTAVDFAHSAPPAVVYGAALSQEIYTEVTEEFTRSARTSLEATAERLRAAGIETSIAVVDGAPAEAIIDEARHGDLIVMTSHGRGGFKRWLLGSVAEKLIRHSPAPVVLVPARGANLTSAELRSREDASVVEPLTV